MRVPGIEEPPSQYTDADLLKLASAAIDAPEGWNPFKDRHHAFDIIHDLRLRLGYVNDEWQVDFRDSDGYLAYVSDENAIRALLKALVITQAEPVAV